MPHAVIVDPKGGLRSIYDPVSQPILEKLGGKMVIRRASHVEPSGELSHLAIDYLWKFRSDVAIVKDPYQLLAPFDTGWWADMLPVFGPVLGPFPDREAALAAEVAWLNEHNIPLPG